MSMEEQQNPKLEIRDQRSGDWLWTHKAILFSQFVTVSAFKVYCGLASYAGNSDQKSWPSIATLATRLNMSRTTVILALKQLEHLSIISKDKNKGYHNVYMLLDVKEVQPPKDVKKPDSPHHRLIAFFHDNCVKLRKVKPSWSPRDTGRLKSVLALGILDENQLEQLMLFFLGSYRFKKFAPTLSVFFSAGIFTGLQNTIKNDTGFWKELDTISAEARVSPVKVELSDRKLSDMLAALSKKMTMPSNDYARR